MARFSQSTGIKTGIKTGINKRRKCKEGLPSYQYRGRSVNTVMMGANVTISTSGEGILRYDVL